MASSRQHTLKSFWGEALRGVQGKITNVSAWERMELTARAVNAVVSLFYTLIYRDYLTKEPVIAEDDEIMLGDIPYMQAVGAVGFTLESTAAATGVAEAMGMEEFIIWRDTKPQNAGRVIFTFARERLRLRKAADLTNYGDLTLWYPALPVMAETDDDAVDIPDGAPSEIALLKLQSLIRERLGIAGQDRKEDYMRLVQAMAQNYGAQLSKEEIKSKVEALA